VRRVTRTGESLSARAELAAGQHLLNQRGERGFVHRCEPHQTRVHTLQLSFRERVEIDQDGFRERAEEAKTGCIISRALGGVEQINLSATLVS
jgi:hypothetical protein